MGSLLDREVACSVSDRQGLIFESCVWRVVSSHSSHHPQLVLLAQFSLYVHKSGLKPDSFHYGGKGRGIIIALAYRVSSFPTQIFFSDKSVSIMRNRDLHIRKSNYTMHTFSRWANFQQGQNKKVRLTLMTIMFLDLILKINIFISHL